MLPLLPLMVRNDHKSFCLIFSRRKVHLEFWDCYIWGHEIEMVIIVVIKRYWLPLYTPTGQKSPFFFSLGCMELFTSFFLLILHLLLAHFCFFSLDTLMNHFNEICYCGAHVLSEHLSLRKFIIT